MRKPRIAIPLCLDANERWRAGRSYQYIDRAYADAVDAAGAHPVFLPIQSTPEAALADFDGLLLPGGDDFEPDRAYPAHVEFEVVPQEQLRFDRALLAVALERRQPVLGLCYGAQLLALHGGGRLHAHLPIDQPAAHDHQLGDDGRHAIEIEAGSRFADLVGTTRASVNSLHHQGIADPGSALRACAFGLDGVIEAVETTNPDLFVFGVQWHPEKLDDGPSEKLFRGFVEACKRARE